MFLQAIWDRINPPAITSLQQDKAALIKLYKSSPVRSKWRKGDEDGGLGNYNANDEDDEIIAHEEEEGDFADDFKLSENLTTEDDQDGEADSNLEMEKPNKKNDAKVLIAKKHPSNTIPLRMLLLRTSKSVDKLNQSTARFNNFQLADKTANASRRKSLLYRGSSPPRETPEKQLCNNPKQ